MKERIYTQRLTMQARVQGGYLYLYGIFDGEKQIGTLTVKGSRKNKNEIRAYTMDDTDYGSAKAFIAAYEKSLLEKVT